MNIYCKLGLILSLLAICYSRYSVTGNEETDIKYTPDWKSLDSRPLPQWYDNAKVGIFIHWGVFSVPSFGDHKHAAEWFWWYWKGVNMTGFSKYMENNYPPQFQYPDFASHFNADLFDPNEWAELFQRSGARYVIMTAKHHEGFCNWATKYSFNWNSVAVGPQKDLVDLLATSIRQKTNLTFGLYHSLFEWFNPMFLDDEKNKFQTQQFVKRKTMPELYEIVNRYKPDVIWSDGDWGATDKYWNSTQFIAWLYNDSPVKKSIVVNDRWGSGVGCHHGDFYTCQDRYNPGKLVNHKWENCFTLDKYSWGFRREMKGIDVMTIEEVLLQLVSTVSCGGNVLINIGPTSSGTIPPVFQERLTQLGMWLSLNGEAIYDTRPWKHQNDSISNNVWYTAKPTPASSTYTLYAILLAPYPKDGLLKLGSLNLEKSAKQIILLGYGPIQYTIQTNSTIIKLPPLNSVDCRWAWSLKINGVTN